MKEIVKKYDFYKFLNFFCVLNFFLFFIEVCVCVCVDNGFGIDLVFLCWCVLYFFRYCLFLLCFFKEILLRKKILLYVEWKWGKKLSWKKFNIDIEERILDVYIERLLLFIKYIYILFLKN